MLRPTLGTLLRGVRALGVPRAGGAIIAGLVAAGSLAGMPALAQQQSRPHVSDLSEGQRDLLHQEIRAYLLENPEVIFEAIEVFEERRNAAAARADQDLVAEHAEAIFEDGHSWIGGNPDGDVTVIEFSDYRCGFCKRAHPEVKQLLEADPNVRLIVKEFPILGPDSTAAGRMAIAANEVNPELYSELNDALMSFPQNLTETSAYRIAKSVGYDIEELKTRAAERDILVKLERNYQLAQNLGLQGTPSFIVGNEIIRGYLPLADMLAVVEREREEAATAQN